ncbi:MAG: hypothetical protein EOP15_20685 [Pseudomonas sp.]|nr:MAG: hypothetical protein EOP15_20685 [Pseudomonas sp.]
MIKGSTQLVAIVGSPIAQVKSPENFNRWFAEQGQDTAMLAIDLQHTALDGIGTGGVGSAIAYSLCQAGLTRLAISDLDGRRVEALAELLRTAFPHIAISASPASLAELDLVVNASPVGMGATGDGPMPVPVALMQTLRDTTLVADVVTAPALTPFLSFARGMGCAIQTGPEMALAQLGNLGHFMGVTPLDI